MKQKVDPEVLKKMVSDKSKSISDIAYELGLNISNLYTNPKYRKVLIESGRLEKKQNK